MCGECDAKQMRASVSAQLKSPNKPFAGLPRNEKVLPTFANAKCENNFKCVRNETIYILFHVRNLHINSLESVRAIVFFEREHIAPSFAHTHTHTHPQTCRFHQHHIVHCADLLCTLSFIEFRTNDTFEHKRSVNSYSVERAFDDNVLLATCIASMPRNNNRWKHLYFHFY